MLTASAEVVAGLDRNFYEEGKTPEKISLEDCTGVATYVINKSLNIINITLFKDSLDNMERFKGCEKINIDA